MAGEATIALRRGWTTGVSKIACFNATAGLHFLVRLVDPPIQPLPLPSCEVTVGHGPFTLLDERRLLTQHVIDVLVSKASGEAATKAKIIAARELGLPVIMVRRRLASRGKRSRPSRRRLTGSKQ